MSGLALASVAVIVPAVSRFSGEVSAAAEVMTGATVAGAGGDEGDVGPVVRGVVGGGREDAGRAVGEDAAGDAGGQHTVGPAVGGGEVVRGVGVVLRGAVGDDVGRAGLDRDWRREGADLPARFARSRETVTDPSRTPAAFHRLRTRVSVSPASAAPRK